MESIGLFYPLVNKYIKSILPGMNNYCETEKRWLEQARFEGPFGEREASGKLLERYAHREGWQVRDLEAYGLLFVLPLVGDPAKSYLVVAESDLGLVNRAVGWIWSRMGWPAPVENVMIGRCVPTEEGLKLKIERGGGSGWANPDQALFDRAVKAGVIIAKDPSVKFYGGPMTGIGAGPSAGGAFGATWEDKMAAENAKMIQQRKKELWLGEIDRWCNPMIEFS